MRWDEIRTVVANSHEELEAALEKALRDALGCRDLGDGALVMLSDGKGWSGEFPIEPDKLDLVERAIWSPGEDGFLRQFSEIVINHLRGEGRLVDGTMIEPITVGCQRHTPEVGG